MKTSRVVVMGAAVLSLLAIPVIVKAGAKYTYTVVTNGTTYAYGSMGDARNSSDPYQYIGCHASFNAQNASYYAACDASDSTGLFFYCSTTDSRIVDIIQSISDASYIYVGSSGGTCTYVDVQHYSYNRPRTP